MKYRVVYASVGVLSGHLPGEEVEITDQQDAAHLLGLGVIAKIKAAPKPDPAAKAQAEAEAKATAEARKKAEAEAKAKAAKPAPAKAEGQPAQEGTDATGQPASSK